jgi:hypothetical protein
MSEYLKKKGYPRAFQPAVFGPKRFNFTRDYTLAVDPGSYTWTGTAAGSVRGFSLPAASGSIGWTGTDATLTYTPQNPGIVGLSDYKRKNYPRAFQPEVFGKSRFNLTNDRTFTVDPGSFSWTGTTSTLLEGYSLTATSDVVAWAGTPATLSSTQLTPSVLGYSEYQRRKNYPRAFAPEVFGHKKTFGFVNAYSLQSDPGAVTLVGVSTNLVYTPSTVMSQLDRTARVWPRPFAPSPWGHLTTQVSKNRIGSATLSYALPADPGTVIWTGTATSLLEKHVIPASSGSWSWNTVSANLNKGFTFSPSAGSFLVNAPITSFDSTRVSLSGVYVWNGTNVTFKLIPALPAGSGSFLWTGNASTTLRYSAQTPRSGMLLLGAG